MAEEAFYKQPTVPDLTEKDLEETIPDTIGPYKIESLLTKGGMSHVYLAVEPEKQKTIVVKTLSPKYINHPEMVEFFFKEANIISLADHPNIVKVYGQGEWEKGLYIAMEFIRGVSLKQFISQHSLSLKRSIDIILQVAYALCHLHSHGVIHRDLKPENVLITESGEVKVIDFGIAQLHENNKVAYPFGGRLIGTPDYMSPEQKKDPLNITFSSDIYSLGIIAYELIIGKLSYGIVHLSLLPKELRAIIEKAIESDPADRYQDIVHLITAFSSYLKSGAVEKDRPGSDQWKETMEELERATQKLSPLIPPEWPQIDVGMTKYASSIQIGLYYDWIALPDLRYFLLIAESEGETVQDGMDLAYFRGMVHTLLKQPETLQNFTPLNFANKLNQTLLEDASNNTFSVSSLLLDCVNDKLNFLSCNLGSLWHLTEESKTPRRLTSINPPLGKNLATEFLEMTDTFNIGDTVVFHSFDTSLFDPKEENPFFDHFSIGISQNAYRSPQRAAEGILENAIHFPSFPQMTKPKILFTLQRSS